MTKRILLLFAALAALSVPALSQVTVSVANAASTGTTVNTLTKFTGAPSTAVIAATTDTAGIVGITIAGAGTSGNAVIALEGLISCVFDGATTANDYVQISSTTAGDCHDTGSGTPPTSGGQIIGIVTSTNGSAGTYTLKWGGGSQASSSAPSFPVTVAGTVNSGGIPYFNSTTQESSSALLPSGDFVLGGGTGSAPTATFSVVPKANGGTGSASFGTFVGPASAYSNATTSLTTVLTSPTVAANATIAFHCWGLYSFTTTAEKAEFGITTSQTPQSIAYSASGQYQTSNAAVNTAANEGNGTASGTIVELSQTVLALSTNYYFNVEGVILWNASTAGTFTLGAATSATAGTINIAVDQSSCTILP